MRLNWRFWATKAEKIKLNVVETDIVDLITKKKELEMDIAQVKLELENKKKEQELMLEKLKAHHAIELDRSKYEFDKAKQTWEIEKAQIEKKLTHEFEMKEKEVLLLKKLETEQAVAKAQIDSEKKLQEEVKKLNDKQIKMEADMYEKLAKSMAELHEKGNAQTKFVQELSLKMLDQSSNLRDTRLNLNVGQGPIERAAQAVGEALKETN